MWEERALLKNATVAFLKEGIRATTKTKATKPTPQKVQPTKSAPTNPAAEAKSVDKVREMLRRWNITSLPVTPYYYICPASAVHGSWEGKSYLCFGDGDTMSGDSFGPVIATTEKAQKLAEELKQQAQEIVMDALQKLLEPTK